MLRIKGVKILDVVYEPLWAGYLSRYSDWLGAGRSGDRIQVEARFSAPVQTGPGAHSASYTMGNGSFPGVKRPGRGVDHRPPSSAEVKERVELYLYSTSGPSWPVLGWILPLPLPVSLLLLKNVSRWAFPSARVGYRNHVTARAAAKTCVGLIRGRGTFPVLFCVYGSERPNVSCPHLQKSRDSLLYLEDGVMKFLRNVDICTKLTVPLSSRP